VKKRNEKKHWRNMFLERFLNVKDWAKKTTQYLLRRTYQNKFLPFKAWANKRILPRIKKGTKGFLSFVKENLENYFLDFYSITWTFSLSTISSFPNCFWILC
jgi:NAD-specific glutamate dehydrogenase